mgnify:FL=1|tara:strand:- start:219 stop:335 length:117 start_codon:yes stop_codon:yes gene_type:complete
MRKFFKKLWIRIKVYYYGSGRDMNFIYEHEYKNEDDKR